MSSASSALGALAVLSIILATTAGTESEVTGHLSSTTGSIVSSTSRRMENVTSSPVTTTTTITTTTAEYPEITNVATTAASIGTVVTTSPSATSASPAEDPSTTVKATISSTSTTTPGPPLQERLVGSEGLASSSFPRETTRLSATTTSVVQTMTTMTTTTTPGSSIVMVGKNVAAKSRNDLVGGTFHEIKPAQKVNSAGYIGGKMVKPNVASALGKYTPYFEDGQTELNVTARIGSTVILDCEIGMLGNKTVTWSYHSADVFRLLTVGRNAYSVDQRISLYFRYPTNWRLRIQYATPRDSGLYECQVATYPPLVKKIHLLVTAPILVIMDDSGRIKSGERHLKAGSSLHLRCEARDVPERYNETVIWTRGDEILNEDVSENRTTELMDGREIQVIVSTIVIERATPRHAGNYSCVVPEKARATVAVHVLNGELPAAVHDGNGVSKSVLNLWLIHLTVSYVFSR
ncbi:uncharacterized protein LOC100679016 [Nasonia vitripennis]|uniref:Ig-like domain-containing protein n=1 Tax=Nasonia vitripennis TaxID=7425 RepID=A0A7M7IYC4_NASVI|nr:uncharacterized protein LOC100679016 [Nasonia vitripennis]XP_016840065.1 uncharacterized protein LOC100679016 [Nasonia vitripennis]XP_031782068.1 uncharacterized protein LOC100679016 [Nasonia vitripennis]